MAQWADGAKRPDYDRTREPLEVFALNEKFQRATGSIPYTSLQWCRRYYESGTFSMTVPEDVYDPSWAYIYTDFRYETGVIQKVEFSDTAHTPEGRDTVTVSGFFLEELLNSITFLDEQPVTVEKKIWHPYKKASWRKLDSFPDVYQDPTGDYYYEDEAGQIVSADDGRVVSSEGLTQVDYHNPGRIGAYWNVDEDENIYRDTYNYLVADDRTTLYRKSPIKDTESFEVDFITDRNDVFYHDDYGQLCIAFGIAEENMNGVFWTSSNRWNDERGEWEVQQVTVQGPWQRTGTFDTVTENDPVDTCIKWVRMFCGNEMVYAETALSGTPRAIDPSFQLLGDLVHSVLQAEEMSYRVEYNFLNDGFLFSIWQGKDRTQGDLSEEFPQEPGAKAKVQWQENEEPTTDGGKAPWAVFSDTWGTIYDYTASRDESNYRNTCYVLYDYDEPDSFDADGVPESQTMMTTGETLLDITGWTVFIPHHKEQGWLVAKVGDDDEPIVETYLDLRDTKPAVDNLWSKEGTSKTYDNADGNRADAEEEAKAAAAELVSTEEDGTMPNFEQVYATFKDSLMQQGVEYLMRSYPVITNLDTGAVDTLGYMVDWDLGDKVEFGVSKVGLAMQARIVAVDEVYESGKSEIRIEIGESRLGPMDKARLLK